MSAASCFNRDVMGGRARTNAEGRSEAQGAFDERDWRLFLEERLSTKIRVSFGRSRTAPVQARTLTLRGGHSAWEIRLHSMFKGAPPEVRDALVKWLRSGRRATKAGPVLDRWIHSALAELPAKVRRIPLETQGDVHDLGALSEAAFEEEFEEEFAGEFAPMGELVRPSVTWGRRVRSRSRRSLRLGSFEPESRVVRIHPALDQDAVPAWFVSFILKHEILHSVIDAYRDASGRWVHHGPEFRAREESWREYAPAVAWERRNLARLIRSAREGTRLRVREEDIKPLPSAPPRQVKKVGRGTVPPKSKPAPPSRPAPDQPADTPGKASPKPKKSTQTRGGQGTLFPI